MIISLRFSGCSCGCTPSVYPDLESDNESELVDGAAWFYATHLVHGGNPFKKVGLSTEPVFDNKGPIDVRIRKAVEEKAQTISLIMKEIGGLESKLEKSFIPPYITSNPELYPLSGMQLEINGHQLTHWGELKKEWKNRVDELNKQLNFYRENYCHLVVEESED